MQRKQASLVVQMVKCLHAMQETWVRSSGREDLLEKGMATHSSILVWRIPWTEEPGGYSPRGHKESDTTERLARTHTQRKHLVQGTLLPSTLGSLYVPS